ncbi:MAG: HEAT repeat domain-containing protein [Methanobacteriaceae archaeon]
MVKLILDSDGKPDIEAMQKDKDIDGLVHALKNDDFLIRKEAARALKYVGDESSVNALIDALKFEEWQSDYVVLDAVRENAAEALGRIGDKKAIEPLIMALKDRDEDVRWKSAWALGRIGDKKAVEPLIQLLEDDEGDVRKHAAAALGNIGDERAVESLIKALKDKEWTVRKCAVTALGKIGDERALKPLLQALNDEDSDVKRRVIQALEKMKELAIDPLIKAFYDKDWRVQAIVAEALGKIGDEKAVKPLIRALTDKDKIERNRYVRGKAAEALGRIGDERAIEPLIDALNEKYIYVRRKAEKALERLGQTSELNYYDDENISFKYSDSWIIEEGKEKEKLISGKLNGTHLKFSVNRRKDLEFVSLEEFSELVKDVFLSQKAHIISESSILIDNQNGIELVIENLNIEYAKKVKVVAFKKEEVLYYLLFSGYIEEFDDNIKYIEPIIDSFHVKIK